MESISEGHKSSSGRGRPAGFDQKKAAVILRTLAQNPDGLWLRRIAKRTGLHPTTVSKYVDNLLRPLVDDIFLGSDEKPIMRVIRLKPSVIKRLQEGASLDQILHFSEVLKSVGKPSGR